MREGVVDRRFVLRLAAAAAGSLGFSSLTIVTSADALAQAQNTPARPKAAPRKPVVVLDPGHGGADPGAISISGNFEKEIALAAAREVGRQLEATKRYKVVLTRDDDEFVSLRDRVLRARAVNADLFLSLHADALPDAGMRGASIFTLSEQASDREAAALAARENKADLVAGIDLSRHTPEVGSILLDLARRQTNNLSIGLAKRLVAELGQDVRLLQNSHRSAGFAVLKAPDVPSALVEMGCLSNREEEKLLRNGGHQKKLAAGLVRSVNAYFDHVAKA